VDIKFPWEHPDYATFSERHRELLDNARLFSETMYGAAILYNWMLAEAFPLKEKVAEYKTMFAEWTNEMTAAKARIRKWDLMRFWTILAREFVQDWVTLLLQHGADLGKSNDARRLVRRRETDLKKTKSRFNNQSAGRNTLLRERPAL
jgi:uncharacterized protein DUF6361